MSKIKKDDLGVPRSKAAGRSTPAAGEDAERSAPPSRKETRHERVGRMVLEIAGAMSFNAQIDLDKSDRGLYMRAFIAGCHYVQSCNRKARDLEQQRKNLYALGIGAARAKRSGPKDGTRAKPGASRATPKK